MVQVGGKGRAEIEVDSFGQFGSKVGIRVVPDNPDFYHGEEFESFNFIFGDDGVRLRNQRLESEDLGSIGIDYNDVLILGKSPEEHKIQIETPVSWNIEYGGNHIVFDGYAQVKAEYLGESKYSHNGKNITALRYNLDLTSDLERPASSSVPYDIDLRYSEKLQFWAHPDYGLLKLSGSQQINIKIPGESNESGRSNFTITRD